MFLRREVQPGAILAFQEDITIAGASARNATAMPVGRYVMCADADCWVLQGDSSVAASSTTAILLPARTPYEFPVLGAATAYMAVIQKSAGGTLNLAAKTE